jgi:hypothetical protein
MAFPGPIGRYWIVNGHKGGSRVYTLVRREVNMEIPFNRP